MDQAAHALYSTFVPLKQDNDETHFLREDDAWSMNIFVNLARERMDSRGRGAWLETVEHPGAGHIMDPPYGAHTPYSYQQYLPVVSEDGSSKVCEVPVLWGGHAKDQCRAQEDLWPRMKTFLSTHVQDNTVPSTTATDHFESCAVWNGDRIFLVHVQFIKLSWYNNYLSFAKLLLWC